MPITFADPTAGCPSARIRFGPPVARRVIVGKRPRRLRIDLALLTMKGSIDATLVALTLYGATLQITAPPRRRELIALRLQSGKRIRARVSWRLGTRCGVTFLTPVADFARLLREWRANGSGARGNQRRVVTPLMEHRRTRPNLAHRIKRALTKTRRMSRRLLRWCRAV